MSSRGFVRHSDRGIMKAHWDRHDLKEMFSMKLKFTTNDVLLIHLGMDAFRSRRNQRNGLASEAR